MVRKLNSVLVNYIVNDSVIEINVSMGKVREKPAFFVIKDWNSQFKKSCFKWNVL